MVAIKDFGMPSCCENCNMCNNRNLDTFYCCITLNDVSIDEKAHDCPLVEIKEHKVGKWIRKPIRNEKGGCIGAEMICSYCKKDNEQDEKLAYCPNCGAKMEGVENDI